MSAEFSRLTGKYQATVPAGVRRRLGVGAGDRLAWVVEGDSVVLRRATAKDQDFAAALSATLGEWATTEDEAAWRDL